MKVLPIILLTIAAAAYSENLCPKIQEVDWKVELLLPHRYCNKFYQCTHGQPVEMSCPPGSYFSITDQVCTWREDADCGNRITIEDSKPDDGKSEEVERPVLPIIEFLPNGCPDQNIPVQNIVAFSGDNTNTNFGGRDRIQKKQLSDRLINKYLGNQTTQLYNKLKNEGTINTSQSETFDKETGDFFNTAICYLEQWTEPMTKFDVFAWMILNDIPQWQQVEETTKYLNEKDIGIDDSMYEEFMYLKSFIECEISDEWKAKNMEAKWKHFF
ncbi:unnamed protein product [Parnassius apollo]|uniref:(apollo) hypothetical protein n=1 Tax=Parnassius apollo TaxID=110799 RepID=A0A8S3W683_PARAO|nr:unnamed protein product [Parnassius apollo]